MGKRISRVLAAGLAVLAIAPDEAFADLGLIFDRARAVPGERVEAFSGQRDTGRPSAYPPIEDVRVYFVPVELVKPQAATALRQSNSDRSRHARDGPATAARGCRRQREHERARRHRPCRDRHPRRSASGRQLRGSGHGVATTDEEAIERVCPQSFRT